MMIVRYRRMGNGENVIMDMKEMDSIALIREYILTTFINDDSQILEILLKN